MRCRAWTVEKTKGRFQTDSDNGLEHVTVQQCIAETQESVETILRRTAVASVEMETFV
jgi:hypothetical protein